MSSLKPSQIMTAIGIGGAAISGLVGSQFNLEAGLVIADVVLIANAVAPYLAKIGD